MIAIAQNWTGVWHLWNSASCYTACGVLLPTHQIRRDTHGWLAVKNLSNPLDSGRFCRRCKSHLDKALANIARLEAMTP